MPNAERPAKKATRKKRTTTAKEATTAPKKAPEAKAEAADDFYERVAKDVGELTEQPFVLLNVPIWGWQYSGKTCALLTALHYCTPELHGMGLARVKDTDELHQLEESLERYRGLGLSTLAEATTARLTELNEQFFGDLEWPLGIDVAMHYLLEVRAASGPLGFVLFPDIMGGSYEKGDEVSKNAIANAHAMILLVDANEYQQATPKAKEYRDDILFIIQRCARDRVPTCVMITKDDEYQADSHLADETHANLTTLLERQQEGFVHSILRVSAIGDIEGDWSNAPPTAAARKPERLVQGWVWALHAALTKPREETLQRVPRINLKDATARQPRLSAETIPEIRIVRHQTGSPGTVLAAANRGRGSRFFVLDSDAGELTEVSIDSETDSEEVGRSIPIEEWQGHSPAAHATSGAVFLGPRETDSIWYAARGQSLARTPLPYPMAAWAPIADRSLVGVDGNGTVHTLSFSSGKWVDKDYRSDFIATGNLSLGVVTPESLVIVHNGAATAAIRVTDKGKLGALAGLKLAVRYDTPRAAINSLGIVAALKSDNSLVFGREKEQAAGPTLPGADAPFALADASGSLAWVTPDHRLRAALISGDKLRVTPPEQSPQLDEAPSGMSWSTDGNLLLITFPSGSWAWARRFGF